MFRNESGPSWHLYNSVSNHLLRGWQWIQVKGSKQPVDASNPTSLPLHPSLLPSHETCSRNLSLYETISMFIHITEESLLYNAVHAVHIFVTIIATKVLINEARCSPYRPNTLPRWTLVYTDVLHLFLRPVVAIIFHVGAYIAPLQYLLPPVSLRCRDFPSRSSAEPKAEPSLGHSAASVAWERRRKTTACPAESCRSTARGGGRRPFCSCLHQCVCACSGCMGGLGDGMASWIIEWNKSSAAVHATKAQNAPTPKPSQPPLWVSLDP